MFMSIKKIANPGNFTIEMSLHPEPNLQWIHLGTVADSAAPSLSVYTEIASVPNPNQNISPHGIIRVTYS